MNRIELTQRLSGHFLANHLPKNWHKLSDKELDKFIDENKWEPLQDLSIQEVNQLICAITLDVEDIIENWLVEDAEDNNQVILSFEGGREVSDG
jgi:uncharacterized protein YeeX (DUF496 family)